MNAPPLYEQDMIGIVEIPIQYLSIMKQSSGKKLNSSLNKEFGHNAALVTATGTHRAEEPDYTVMGPFIGSRPPHLHCKAL